MNQERPPHEMWKVLTTKERRRVLTAVQKGERLGDPQEAQLAVYLASRSIRHYRFFPALIVPVVAAMMGLGWASSDSNAKVVLLALVTGAVFGAIVITVCRRDVRRLRRTVEMNRGG